MDYPPNPLPAVLDVFSSMTDSHTYNYTHHYADVLRQMNHGIHFSCEEHLQPVVEHIRIIMIASECWMNHRDRRTLMHAQTRMAEFVNLTHSYKFKCVRDAVEDSLDAMMSNMVIPVASRIQCAVKSHLLSMTCTDWKNTLDCLYEHPKLSKYLPTCLAVFLFTQEAHRGPKYRSLLHRASSKQWDIMQILNYLGRNMTLVRCMLRNVRHLPRNFKYEQLSYQAWPMQQLVAWLRKDDLLIALFALSEYLYEESTTETCRSKMVLTAVDLSLALESIPEEKPPIISGVRSWKRKTRLKQLMYHRCLKVHAGREFGLCHFQAHQELRLRRLRVMLKLHPTGSEYLQLWLKLWTDIIHNVTYCRVAEEEIMLMRMCEEKIQKVHLTGYCVWSPCPE